MLFLLLSNAVTLRRDKSILYNRTSIIILLYSSFIAFVALSLSYFDSGIGLYGGLFHATNITQVFHIFIFLISAAILQLTGFYPRKVWIPEYSSINKFFFSKFIYYSTKILNKMGEQFKIIEYPKRLKKLQNKTLYSINLIECMKLRNDHLHYLKLHSKCFSTHALLNAKNITESSVINSNNNLNPWFLTGFTDGDGSFNIRVSKDPNGKLICKVQPVFTIGLHLKDLPLLELIQKYFGGVGRIYIREEDKTVYYNISSVKEIMKFVIPHFDKYSLVTQKQADFLLFKEIVNLMNNKEHLTDSGLIKIISLKSSLNLGLNGWTADLIKNIEPVVRPKVKVLDNLNSYWVSGFICAEGCFNVVLSKNDKLKAGYSAKIRFILTQNNRDALLLNQIKDFFNSGNVNLSNRDNTAEFRITDFQAIKNNLVPFLDKYPLIGAKTLEYLDFKAVLNLIDNKIHLTKEGCEQIRIIKEGMNTKRK
jgi:hypothetical protein